MRMRREFRDQELQKAMDARDEACRKYEDPKLGKFSHLMAGEDLDFWTGQVAYLKACPILEESKAPA